MIKNIEYNSDFNLTTYLERLLDNSQEPIKKSSDLLNETTSTNEVFSNGNSVHFREKILNDLWKMIQRQINSNGLLNWEEKEVFEIKSKEILSLIFIYQIILNRKDLPSIGSQNLLDLVLAQREEKRISN